MKQFAPEGKAKELTVSFWDCTGLQESAQWWCQHTKHMFPSSRQTACSWHRSNDQDKASERGLNHPGLRLQTVCSFSPRLSWKRWCPHLYKVCSAQINELPGEGAKQDNVGGSEWEKIYKFFVQICQRPARSYLWVGGGWKYLRFSPAERRFFLLLHTCNWRTLATGEKKPSSIRDATDPYIEKVTLRGTKRMLQ